MNWENLISSFDASGCNYLLDQKNLSRIDFINWAVMLNMNYLLDLEQKEANFDSDIFRNILRMSLYLPKQANEQEQYNEYNAIRAGEQFLCLREFYWPENIIRDLPDLFPDGFSICGFPDSPGSGSAISPVIDVGILSQSPNAERCALFLKFILSDNIQKRVQNFPAQYNVFSDIKNSSISSAPEEKRENLSLYFNETERAINESELVFRNNLKTIQIVDESVQGFLNGDKSINQTVSRLNERIQLYINEQAS